MAQNIAILSFTLYWRLKNCFSGEQFYKFYPSAKNILVPIPFHFAARNISHCSSFAVRFVIRPVFTLDA